MHIRTSSLQRHCISCFFAIFLYIEWDGSGGEGLYEGPGPNGAKGCFKNSISFTLERVLNYIVYLFTRLESSPICLSASSLSEGEGRTLSLN